MKPTTWMTAIRLVVAGIILVAFVAWTPDNAEAAEPVVEPAQVSSDAAGVGTPAPFTAFSEPEEMPVALNLRIAGSTLKPRANDADYATSGSGGCVYVTGGDQYEVWNTPLALPQGAVVSTLRMYYDDTSATDSTAFFTIYDLYGTIISDFSVSTSGSSGNGYRDSDPIDHQIDYGTYSYVLNWRPMVGDSTMQLCGFRIFYDTP